MFSEAKQKKKKTATYLCVLTDNEGQSISQPVLYKTFLYYLFNNLYTSFAMSLLHAAHTHTLTPLTTVNLHASTVPSGGQTVTVNNLQVVSQQSLSPHVHIEPITIYSQTPSLQFCKQYIQSQFQPLLRWMFASSHDMCNEINSCWV
jgi:hypothetical protein